MADLPDDTPAGLARNAEWLRSLARRLARDAADADDLAQDAWVAVLERAPSGARRIGTWRGFLGGVLRNKRRQSARAAGRRRDHERRAAEANAERSAPAADEALARAELARAVVDCVLALDEPFRASVLLVHGEGLTAAEAARRLGVPLKTVESRVRRGLERLRATWTRMHGDARPAWRDALAFVALPLGSTAAPPLGSTAAPPLGPSVPTTPTTAAAGSAHLAALGALAVQTKLIAVLAVAAGCAGALWLALGRDTGNAEPSAPGVAALRADAELAPVGALELEPSAARRDRERAAVRGADAVQSTASEPAAPAAAATRRVHGRVFDVDARPVAGARVVWLAGWDSDQDGSGRLETRSAVDGAFEVHAPPSRGRVRVEEPGLATLVSGRIQGSADVEVPLVVAGFRALAGRALDEAGRPVPGSQVRLELPAGFLGRFGAIFDATVAHVPETRSADDGAFAFERAPVVPGARVVARLDGYVPAEVDAPLGAAFELELVLRRAHDAGELAPLVGRVVDGAGLPAAGAWVTLGAQSAVTDATGTFALPRADAGDSCALRALKKDHRPALLEVERDAATGAPAWPSWIELRLGGPPLRIDGRVADELGRPRAGVRVWVEDSTPFGVIGGEAEVEGRVEFLLAHEAGPAGEAGDAYWYAATTDAEGGFELPGLLERDYRLRLLDSERRETLVAGPFRAGADAVRVAFPREPLGALRGRVVARSGAPVAGVALSLHCATFGGVWTEGGSARTGDDGRFAFAGVGNAALSVAARGDEIVPLWLFLDDGARADELEIVVDRICHLKVELVDPRSADAFRVLDAGGKILGLYAIDAGGITFVRQMELVDGRSRTIGVAESAATLVLELGNAEVARAPLRLGPDALNTVLR
jgi:RNA polymerase sigma-70 factor (ECF subfamily)